MTLLIFTVYLAVIYSKWANKKRPKWPKRIREDIARNVYRT